MINNESSADQDINDSQNDITELCEDIEVVSPGAMLLEARKALSLSQEHIAAKLKFSLTLINNIETDNFDPKMPVTFIRGYLSNYAKLVDVDIADVLASYDALGAAHIQRSEMLSFSKETTKQAEHSRVMWLSYLIAAVLVGLTVLWWLQDNQQQVDDNVISAPSSTTQLKEEQVAGSTNALSDSKEAMHIELQNGITKSLIDDEQMNEENEENITLASEDARDDESIVADNTTSSENEPVTELTQAPLLSTAVFTFNGDCWVNILDATGERIAWGVKKSGYIMTIEGKAPFKVTVGKPELTSIEFDGQTVDMSNFNVGNIAKFTLPLSDN